MWIFFAGLTPFLYSVTNFIDKYILKKKIKDPSAATVFGSYVASGIGIVILAVQGFPLLSYHQILYLFLSGILLVFYLLPYISALRLDYTSQVVLSFHLFPLLCSHFHRSFYMRPFLEHK